MKTILLAVATLSFYTLALILTAIAARRRALGGAVFAGALGLLLHGVLVVQALLDDGGLRFDLPASLLLIAWLVMLGCLVLALFQALPALLLIGIPVIALTVVTALGLPPAAVDPLHPDPWLDTHVLLAVLAYASLSVACLLAVLLAIADHRLHSHRLGREAEWLPPLETLETALFRTIAVGFGLLTLALLSGFAFTRDWFNHKIVFSVIAWVVFGLLLLGRHRAGWRGQTAIRWTLGGMFSLALAYLGTKWVLEYLR